MIIKLTITLFLLHQKEQAKKMRNNKDYYDKVYQERRCQVGLHNFVNFESDVIFLICKVCKYMQVGSRKITEHKEEDNELC